MAFVIASAWSRLIFVLVVWALPRFTIQKKWHKTIHVNCVTANDMTYLIYMIYTTFHVLNIKLNMKTIIKLHIKNNLN